MRIIKAVLFDFDGTLVNSLEAFLVAARLTLKSLDLPLLPKEKLVEIVKLPFDEWLSITIPPNTPKRTSIVDRFKSDYERFYRKNHLKFIKPINNAFLTLERLREMGLSIGVMTARKLTTDYVRQEIEFLKFNKFINVLVTLNEISLQEPDKVSLILECTRRLNLKNCDCAVVGDSPEDIVAGKDVGALTIGASYGFYGQKIINYHPDFTITTPLEILKILDTFIQR